MIVITLERIPHVFANEAEIIDDIASYIEDSARVVSAQIIENHEVSPR